MTAETLPLPTSPLAYRDFRLFWLARFTMAMATTAVVVVLGYQLYDTARADYGMTIREASFLLGMLGLAQFVPQLLLSPVAGWLADRFERRTVAGVANTLDIGVAITLALATATDTLTLPVLFALAAMHGLARVCAIPSMGAIVPNIVPPSVLPKAIALSAMAWQIASILGPVAGGFLFANDPPSVYWVAAGLMAASVVSLSLIKRVAPPPMSGETRPLRQMAEGLTYTWRDRFLLGAISLDLFAVLLAGATALLPVFARDILHVGPAGLGGLRAAMAIGAVGMALYFSWRPLKHNVGAKMLWAVALFGVATIAFGLSTVFVFSLACLTVMGAADMLSVYVRSSLIQLNTPDAMRGRVGAVSSLAITCSNELGELQSGVFAAVLGPVGAVVFGGAGAILVTAIWARLFPELKNARTFAPEAAPAITGASTP